MRIYYQYIMYSLCPLGTLVYVLCLWCVIFKSNRATSTEYKTLLLIQITLTWFAQFMLSGGTVPIFLTPCFGGFPVGFLRYLGISTIAQVIIQIWLYVVIAGAIAALFFHRYAVILPRESRLSDRSGRTPIYVFFFVLTTILPGPVAIIFQVTNQFKIKSLCLTMVTEVPSYYWEDDVIIFSITESDNIFRLTLVMLFFVIIVAAGTVGASCIMTVVTMKKYEKSMSKSTRKLQKAFFQALLLQVITQFSFLLLPVIAFFIIHSLSLDLVNFRISAFTDICFVFLALSGIGGPLTLILATASYRRACIQKVNKILPYKYKIFRSINSEKTTVVFTTRSTPNRRRSEVTN